MTEETRELLRKLCTTYRDDLSEKQRAAFDSMRELPALSEKQERWVYAIAEKFGLAVAPAKNVFSDLSEKKQQEHRERAARVQLPWERSGYAKITKPPGSRR